MMGIRWLLPPKIEEDIIGGVEISILAVNVMFVVEGFLNAKDHFSEKIEKNLAKNSTYPTFLYNLLLLSLSKIKFPLYVSLEV